MPIPESEAGAKLCGNTELAENNFFGASSPYVRIREKSPGVLDKYYNYSSIKREIALFLLLWNFNIEVSEKVGLVVSLRARRARQSHFCSGI